LRQLGLRICARARRFRKKSLLTEDREMTGLTSIFRKPKWHLIYYILAAFDLATISGSLLLNHEIMGVYTDSVDVNKELAEIQGRFIDLGRLASAVNAPGNDVFDSGEVDAELVRRNHALERFEKSMSILRAEVLEKVGTNETTPLIDGLEEIETAMSAMVIRAKQLFRKACWIKGQNCFQSLIPKPNSSAVSAPPWTPEPY
jgi:hypothetical protein